MRSPARVDDTTGADPAGAGEVEQTISDDVAAALQRYVQAGGGLIVAGGRVYVSLMDGTLVCYE